ncbi:hypothetical protein M422DRAFT_261501 [Sphaerobolus stellatus SS14]|uniref:Uncharacterized protein n=1 Tax=Sphaerobolus stellatus (strain SS14) TaxID=990650 RepID=A0A0C9V341_SPHS4|nr:hypothetical protein M422DRAFT_261501 [Sphaerobolus stellatus SS14]
MLEETERIEREVGGVGRKVIMGVGAGFRDRKGGEGVGVEGGKNSVEEPSKFGSLGMRSRTASSSPSASHLLPALTISKSDPSDDPAPCVGCCECADESKYGHGHGDEMGMGRKMSFKPKLRPLLVLSQQPSSQSPQQGQGQHHLYCQSTASIYSAETSTSTSLEPSSIIEQGPPTLPPQTPHPPVPPLSYDS